MPSLGADTTYSGGGSSIRTTGGTALPRGGGRGYGPNPWEQAARRRVNQQLQGGSIDNQMRQFQLDEAQRSARRARAPKMETWDSQTGMDQAMRRNAMRQGSAQTRMSEAQANAMTRGAPQKFTFSQGSPMSGGWMPDTQAMSGAQRQMFLPQSSHLSPIQPSSDVFRSARAEGAGQQAAQVQGIQQMLSMMQSGRIPGAQGYSYMGPQSTAQRAIDERELRMRRPDAQMFNPQYDGQ